MIPDFIDIKGGSSTRYSFIQPDSLPDDAEINAALTFAFIGENLVIVQKKNGWWDVIGGKIEGGETWQTALEREAMEEAGVEIGHHTVVGYVRAENQNGGTNPRFGAINYMPITLSFVKKINKEWSPFETISRDALHQDSIRELFSRRTDNSQLLGMFDYVFDFYKSQNYVYDFQYYPNEDDPTIPNTQSATFVRYPDEDLYLIVHEKGESKLSLPGGGCHMDETSIDCALREIDEEAFVSVKDLHLLGTIVIKIYKDGVLLSTSKQSRFIATLDKERPFPEDSNETSARSWEPLAELSKKVKSLQNQTGKALLRHINSL